MFHRTSIISIRHTKNMFTIFTKCDMSYQLVTFRNKDESKNAKIVPFIQVFSIP